MFADEATKTIVQRLAARSSRALAWAGDSLLAVAAVVAPLAGSLLVTGVLAMMFDAPWLPSSRDGPYPLMLLGFAAPYAMGACFVAGVWPWRQPRSLLVRIAVCVVPSFAAAIAWGAIPGAGIEWSIFSLVISLPFVVAVLPVLFSSPRGSVLKLIVGIAIALWVVFLAVLLVVAFSFFENHDRQYYAHDDAGSALSAHREGSPIYDVTVFGAFWIGLLLGALWSAYAAAAYLSDGLAKRDLLKLPPMDTAEVALLDDLYVRGLIDRNERADFMTRYDRIQEEWKEVAARSWRTRAPRRHGVLLLCFGTLIALISLLGLVGVGVGLAACATDDVCWPEVTHRSDNPLPSIALTGGFALGLGVAAIAAGALALRKVVAHESDANDRVDLLGRAATAIKEEMLDLARSRHAR
jgi:hypothetical protein